MTLEVGNLYRVDKYRWLLSRKRSGMSFLKTGDVIMIIAMGDNQITVINQEGGERLGVLHWQRAWRYRYGGGLLRWLVN